MKIINNENFKKIKNNTVMGKYLSKKCEKYKMKNMSTILYSFLALSGSYFLFFILGKPYKYGLVR